MIDTYTKVFGIRLEERVLFRLGCLASTEGGSSGFLTGSWLGFGRLVIETKSAKCHSRKVNNLRLGALVANVYFYTLAQHSFKKNQFIAEKKKKGKIRHNLSHPTILRTIHR